VRATQNWQRALALLVAMLVCWLAATMFAAAYWSVPHERGLAWVTPWGRTVRNMLTMGGGILAVMFAPALLELVRRVDNTPHPA
jgi:predicted Abi (CAAX) family protease